MSNSFTKPFDSIEHLTSYLGRIEHLQFKELTHSNLAAKRDKQFIGSYWDQLIDHKVSARTVGSPKDVTEHWLAIKEDRRTAWMDKVQTHLDMDNPTSRVR